MRGHHKLLMLSGDTALARGEDGAFNQMLKRFAPHWERIDILTPRTTGASPRHVHGNVYVHPGNLPVYLHSLFISRYGRRLLRDHQHDLVVSHDFGFFYNGIGAWLLGKPFVSEIHHVEGYPIPATRREKLYRRLAKLYIQTIGKKALGIRTVNHTEIPDLLREWGVPEEKILVLPSLYIDFDVFRPMHLERRYDVLFVGRLASNKGIFTILDAIEQVKKTHPDVRVCMVGQGALEKDLQAHIQQRNLPITHLPRVDDIARIYNKAKILVCASTSEGGPRVTVEAMACGTAVISTPVGIMRDLDSESCLLFDFSADELANHIRTLLDDEEQREKLAEKGRAAVQAFQADDVIAAYADAFHALIEER